MHVRFCGVRGSTPAPGIEFVRYGGHTSCLSLTHDGAQAPALVLDAGIGLRAVTHELAGAPFDGTIVLTHLHWDHVLGLPFFGAGDRVDARVRMLIPEQDGARDAVGLLSGVMSPPYFPITPTELRGSWTFATIQEGRHEVEGFAVLAREIPHKGGRTFGYRISDGRSTLTYMPDHCPTMVGRGEHGFGECHPVALELARDSDLLVHDSQLFPEELAVEADYGHAVGDYAVELARRAGARAVALTHHRFNRTDEALDGLAQRLGSDVRDGGGDGPRVRVAAEGTVVQL